MTHHTDADRADFLAWLRIKPCGAAHDFAWEPWKAARRAPAAPVPDVTDAMIEAANEAYCPFGDMHLAIQAALAAAPQPPEAAPVQLPEPIYTMRVRGRLHEYTPALQAFELDDGEHNLYTEQQLRELLAAHGIQERST